MQIIHVKGCAIFVGIVTIRGATTTNNNQKDILLAAKELLEEIREKNKLDKKGVISILFSATQDLDSVYPARAARELGYTKCGLMCFNEMKVIGSLNKCIRLMILYNGNLSQDEVKHVYLRDAVVLRPDLVK